MSHDQYTQTQSGRIVARSGLLTGYSVARYIRSLAPLIPLTRSIMLRNAPLRSVHRLAHSLRSLPLGTVEIHENVFPLKTRLMGRNASLVVTRNTPLPFDGPSEIDRVGQWERMAGGESLHLAKSLVVPCLFVS